MMKLGINLTSPLFRAWWRGLWTGIFIGSAVVAYIFRDQWARILSSPRVIFYEMIPLGMVFIATIPDGIVEMIAAVRKFRAAAKHQPDL